MNWSKLLKRTLRVTMAVEPLLLAFGVPPVVTTLVGGVEHIYNDKDRPNDDAVALLAAVCDAQERRIAVIEKRLGIDPKKDPMKVK